MAENSPSGVHTSGVDDRGGDTDEGGIVLEPFCPRLKEVSFTDSNDPEHPKRNYFPYMELPAELKNMLNNVLEQDEAIALSSTCSGLRALLKPLAFKSIGLVGEFKNLWKRINEVIRSGWPIQVVRSLKIHLMEPPRDLVPGYISLMVLGSRVHDLLKSLETSLEEITLDWEYDILYHGDMFDLFCSFEEKPLHLANLRVLRVKSTQRKIIDGFFRYLEMASPCLESVSLATFTDDTVNDFEIPLAEEESNDMEETNKGQVTF